MGLNPESNTCKNIKRNVVQTVYRRNKQQSAFFSMFRRANTPVVVRERTAPGPSPHTTGHILIAGVVYGCHIQKTLFLDGRKGARRSEKDKVPEEGGLTRSLEARNL